MLTNVNIIMSIKPNRNEYMKEYMRKRRAKLKNQFSDVNKVNNVNILRTDIETANLLNNVMKLTSFNPSIELNLIKCIYANRFGSSTNKTKNFMIKEIVSRWNNEI